MKPIKLILEAFGSFPGTETIDFASLAPRGLFVVSGDTGTGKTTIFDAMCWALYGKMPLKDAKDVKSDHASPETRTRVVFTFGSGGERYVVTRNPEQFRSAARGSGFTKELANAQLVRVTDNGTESIATGARDTSAACSGLIGLDAMQFQRVILLPQGEFSQFLLADTAQRESLLGQLFGGKVFDDIVDQLKQDRNQLRQQIGAIDNSISAELENVRTNLQHAASPLGFELPEGLEKIERDGMDSLLHSIDAPLAALAAKVAELVVEVGVATEAHHRAEGEATRFDAAEGHRTTLAALQEREPVVRADRASASASVAARPVTVAADALAEARQTEVTAKDQLADRLSTISESFSSIGVEADTSTAGTIKDQVATQRSLHQVNVAALKKLRDALAEHDAGTSTSQAIATDIATASATRSAAAERRDVIATALTDLRSRAVDPDGIKAESAKVTRRVDARRELNEVQAELVDAAANATAVSANYERVYGAFVSTQAPRLAARLVEGEPCPVCGGVEHPMPATGDGDAPTTDDDVQRASAARDAANSAVGVLESRQTVLRSTLDDDVDATIDQLTARSTQLAAQHVQATEDAGTLANLEHEHSTLENVLHTVDLRLARLAEKTDAAREDLAQRTTELDAAKLATSGIDGDDVDRTGKVLDALDGHVTGLEQRFTNVNSRGSAATVNEEQLTKALAASPFDTEGEAREALLSSDDEQAKNSAATEYDKACDAATTALEVLTKQGIPAHAPDLAATESARTAAAANQAARAAECTSATDARQYSRLALKKHDELIEGSDDQRARSERADLAFQVCQDGGPGADMSLKRWVLTRELDRVTAEANVHLHRMTSGRYTLHRGETKADGRRKYGLDLEVLDATTGRARSTCSLSGGEQFQASLALALGLADVVSHGGAASGKTFETLFVDEGFGSLDPRSLDDAIDTLHQLHATGRMVGAITHVEAMKQQLHLGIEVKRLPDAGGSTLVVHP
ncbi:MAG: SMC family ATPase [Acidimicrobiia bacterium]|nr:SMC family ATPase [Acidimicrobiia bacterium]